MNLICHHYDVIENLLFGRNLSVLKVMLQEHITIDIKKEIHRGNISTYL